MRTLPLLVAPVDDETLLSFCRRLAAHNQGSLTGVLAACGLGGDGPEPGVVPHMGIVLDRDIVASFAEAAGITARRAESLLLGSYGGAVDTASCPRAGGPDQLHWSRAHGLLAAGSRACPACLHDDGAFRMAWRFDWSFACPEHGLLLEARCPRCHRPFSFDTDNRRLTQASRVPLLSGCANRTSAGNGGSGPVGRPCGHPFGHLAVRPTTTRATQAHVRARDVARGSPATVHGQSVSAAQWRVELISVVAMVAQLAEPVELGELDGAALAAFEEYVADGRGWGPFSLLRSADPALLAAVVPTAVELLAASSPAEFDEGLAPFVLRGFETRFAFLNVAYARLGVRGRTLQAWSRIVGPVQTLTTRLRSRHGGPDARPGGLSRLPQMLWPEVFDQRFARFLPDVDRDLRRRFCSLALGVLVTKNPYVEVAAALGLTRGDSLVRSMNRLLRDRHEEDTFYQALLEATRWLGVQDWIVDYEQRRRSLADLTGIADQDWQWACSTAGVHADVRSAQHHSSKWLWCALTGGVPELSPTSADSPRLDTEQVTYSQFVHDEIPALKPALVALAAKELQHRCLAGPVRADLSGWAPPPDPVADDITAIKVSQ